MKWTIVIPTRKRAELLKATLDSLSSQLENDFEVIVVCDGEDFGTRNLSGYYEAIFPLRWCFHMDNSGIGFARNAGAKAAHGDFLIFLDDDIVASPDLLYLHEEQHSAAPDWPLSVVFGRIIEDREVPIVSHTDAFQQNAWERMLERFQPAEGMPDTVSVGSQAEQTVWFGLNCSIRRGLFTEMGGFDPALRSDEEVEFGYRLYRQGFQFRYARLATIRHRDTKDMSTYFPRCWHLSGGNDLYRVRERDQRCAQNAQLANMRHGMLVQRAVARSIWRFPQLFLRAASSLECVTDLTASRLSFALWTRVRRMSEYWSAVRDTGVSYEELHRLAGPVRRILLFHSISVPQNAREAQYYISPRRFRRFVSWLGSSGYWFAEPRGWFSANLPEHSVLLTFDDAYDDLYQELLPLVQNLGVRPIVFAVAERVGGQNTWDHVQGLRSRSLLTLAQMREMQRHGVVFGAHSLTHPSLPALSDTDLRREVTDSKARLEDLLGEPVNWFAYPYGEVDRRVRAAVLEAGFSAAVTTRQGLNGWQDPLALTRIELDDRDTLLHFMVKIATGRNLLKGITNRLSQATFRKEVN